MIARMVSVALVLVSVVSAGCTNDQDMLDATTTLVDTITTTSIASGEATTIENPAVTPALPPVTANQGWRQLNAGPLAGRIWPSTAWTGQELIIEMLLTGVVAIQAPNLVPWTGECEA